ncbi:MAG: tRNA (N(6)-L-threonylcarbamoyladenosine(37)-C(2))-methylthiotransferase [Promethearchaeota archaeon]
MIENSFYIETYGCTSNKADSLIMRNVLIKSNYHQTDFEKAQFIIINTCAVKEQTENKIKDRLKTLNNLFKNDPDRYVIIAGCLPHITPEYKGELKKVIPSFSAIIDLNNLEDLPYIIEKLKHSKKNQIFLSNKTIDKARYFINHPKGKITGIVPISEGCLGSCTYCCVKNARGSLNCYDPEQIVNNIEYQLKQGIKQIYLTSQDCSLYNHDGVELIHLIKKIVALPQDFFLRIGMINPSILIDKIDQLISIFNLDKVYQFLHIPIQSGSNEVLKRMQRPYLISEIIDKIEILREKFPYLTISTDIICGFPEETEYEFYRTINFIKWLRPEIINISKFTPRPGTEAKKMKQLDSKLIKKRSIRLSKIFRNSLSDINDKWRDWSGKVLILHEGSGKNQAFGRNFAYKNIFVNDYHGKYGKFVDIKIIKVDGFNLFGKLI